MRAYDVILNFVRGVQKFDADVYKKQINFLERYILTACDNIELSLINLPLYGLTDDRRQSNFRYSATI